VSSSRLAIEPATAPLINAIVSLKLRTLYVISPAAGGATNAAASSLIVIKGGGI
jgi:hypothetical protein